MPPRAMGGGKLKAMGEMMESRENPQAAPGHRHRGSSVWTHLTQAPGPAHLPRQAPWGGTLWLRAEAHTQVPGFSRAGRPTQVSPEGEGDSQVTAPPFLPLLCSLGTGPGVRIIHGSHMSCHLRDAAPERLKETSVTTAKGPCPLGPGSCVLVTP